MEPLKIGNALKKYPSTTTRRYQRRDHCTSTSLEAGSRINKKTCKVIHLVKLYHFSTSHTKFEGFRTVLLFLSKVYFIIIIISSFIVD